jgi:hypothetical protein
MADAGNEHGVVHRGRYGFALAGDQRRRDCGLIA